MDELVTPITSTFSIYATQKNTVRLIIAPGFNVEFVRDNYPSAWVRFWYKALLGWTWERIAPDESGT